MNDPEARITTGGGNRGRECELNGVFLHTLWSSLGGALGFYDCSNSCENELWTAGK